MDGRPIRVLVADDQALMRSGLVSILSTAPDIEVVAEAADGGAAVELCRKHHPDVALLDLRMPVLDGIEATRAIVAHTSTRVIALTTFDSDEYLYGALSAGASGFLLKDDPAESLAEAVRTVHHGRSLLSPSVTGRIIDRFAREPIVGNAALADLTARERDVVLAVASGLSNGETAARLYIGEATVKTHLTSIMTKLGLRDRVQLVVYAYEHGLVRPGERRDLGREGDGSAQPVV